ncbi:MAG: ChbG/HpnK family deacetylase [Acidobacteriota bacterium]
MKRLIVTADDVGLHPGMTRGALAAHDGGIVTAVSVSPNGRDFEPAVELLRDRPRLDVGAHLTLVGERPLSDPARIPSLVGPDGLLHAKYPAFAARYALGHIRTADLETELRAQVERLLATGLRVVHLNSHQHLHLLPRVLDVVLELAEEHGIPVVRIPNEPAAGLSPRGLQIRALNALGRRARSGLFSADRTVGVLAAGHLTAEALRRCLDDVDGTTELVCHPGLGGAELAREYDWGYGWDEETAALADPALPGFLEEKGISLATFSEILR